MKTLNSINLIKKLIILFSMFLLIACAQTKSSEQDTQKEKTAIEAPKMDIHTAIIMNNVDAVKAHIEAGSDINVKEQMGGSSPLISASLFGKTEIVKALLDAGADLNIQNNDGSTALHTAAFFCRPEIVKLLLEKGADKSLKNKFNNTAYESVIGEFETVKGFYQAMGKMLEPMGLKVDLDHMEKTRPVIAALLK